jgi:hypothetical protein
LVIVAAGYGRKFVPAQHLCDRENPRRYFQVRAAFELEDWGENIEGRLMI